MVERERDQILIPSPALGEIDYLLRVRIGTSALLQLLSDIRGGAFQVEAITAADLDRSSALLLKYSDLDLGLCDAAVVAIADRLHVNRILTVDQRDFRTIRSSRNKPFRLLPADTL